MNLMLLPETLAVCRLAASEAFPAWAQGEFVSVTRTADELSVVCAARYVPEGVQQETSWRALKIAGPLAFSMVGVLSTLATPLASAGISIFVISTFDTDYVLVKDTMLENTIQTLESLGHTVLREEGD